MDVGRNDMLGELASDASLERTAFLVEATEQLAKFLARNRERIATLGGLPLIDDDDVYLAIAPDGTFRDRRRYEDPDSGEWVTETAVIETASELVELYNPAEIFAAFAEAAREAAGLPARPDGTDAALDAAGVAGEERIVLGEDAGYAAAADSWAAGHRSLDAADEGSAATALYHLALDFQERSQTSEAGLIDDFEGAVGRVSRRLGDVLILEREDERLLLGSDGRFRAEVLTDDGTGTWRTLASPEDLVEFYDPTDVFGDLADALAEAFPEVAPEAGEDAGAG